MAAAKRAKIDCDMYLMANVGSRATGLPFRVYISEQQGRSAPWVGVGGEDQGCTVMVSIAAPACVLQGQLGEQQLRALADWIALNRSVLLGYWDRTIKSTSDALAALIPLPNAVRCSS